MRKGEPYEIEVCPEPITAKNSQSGNSVQNTFTRHEDLTREIKVKTEQDEDTPINLVKGNRCISPISEALRSVVTYSNGASYPHSVYNQYSANDLTLEANVPIIDRIELNRINDSKDGVVSSDKKIMPASTRKNSNETNMNSVRLVDQVPSQNLEINDISYRGVSSNSTINVGGMLAKQLESPLRSHYNPYYEKSNNQDDHSYLLSQPSSSKLPSFTLPPSSSLLPSPPGPTTSNLTSYSRSQHKEKELLSNISFCSTSSADLGTISKVALSNVARTAPVSLEEDEQSSPSSNLIVISDSQARHLETAGRKKGNICNISYYTIKIIIMNSCMNRLSHTKKRFFSGYPLSGDQPATIHRIKPTPTSTTPEGSNISETPSAPARLVSNELQGMDAISSSTTSSPAVSNKAHKDIIACPISARKHEAASSTSNSLNPTNSESPSSNNCQNYQHLVGILSTPPIAHNSIMATAAAEAVAAPQDPNISLQNEEKDFSPQMLSQQYPSIPWNPPQHYCEGKCK